MQVQCNLMVNKNTTVSLIRDMINAGVFQWEKHIEKCRFCDADIQTEPIVKITFGYTETVGFTVKVFDDAGKVIHRIIRDFEKDSLVIDGFDEIDHITHVKRLEEFKNRMGMLFREYGASICIDDSVLRKDFGKYDLSIMFNDWSKPDVLKIGTDQIDASCF